MTKTIPTTYVPRADSLASRIIHFFNMNPDEELDLEAITEKFDTSRGNIHTQLGGAIDAAMLERKRNVDGEWIYSRGKNLPKAPHDTKGVDMDSVHKARASKANPRATHEALPCLDDVKIEDDVPLPGHKGRAKTDWAPLLQKLKPKQSCKLPLAAKYTLSQAITTAHKAQLGTYTMRTFPESLELRVWRIA